MNNKFLDIVFFILVLIFILSFFISMLFIENINIKFLLLSISLILYLIKDFDYFYKKKFKLEKIGIVHFFSYIGSIILVFFIIIFVIIYNFS